jgi:hypothetical protein
MLQYRPYFTDGAIPAINNVYALVQEKCHLTTNNKISIIQDLVTKQIYLMDFCRYQKEPYKIVEEPIAPNALYGMLKAVTIEDLIYVSNEDLLDRYHGLRSSLTASSNIYFIRVSLENAKKEILRRMTR